MKWKDVDMEDCNNCPYAEIGCSGGVKGGPHGPIYPPCADAKDDDEIKIYYDTD